MKSPQSSGKPKKRPKYIIRRVSGDSMAPTLKHGRIVIAKRMPGITPGRIVVISHNGLEKIKRVQDLLDGQVFVVGDNPNKSTDSRSFGRIPAESIIGEIIWPRLR